MMKDAEISKFIKGINKERLRMIKKTIELFDCEDVIITPIKKKTNADNLEAVASLMSWNAHDKALINHFKKLDHEGNLPVPPFMLNAATKVTGNKFYESLRREISNRPSSVRAKTGALQYNLEQLFEIVD